MVIKKIILKNIGPYVNTNEFDLTTSSKKNIVLIGGKNGSGKTTFLNAIKYGLFGSFSLGYKNDTKKYYDEIFNLINTENNRKSFYIQISLSIIEDSKENEYILKREWILSADGLEEKVSVFYDGLLYDEYRTLEFIERLKSFTSPQLINSTIFDGEKIGNVIQNDKVDLFLAETFNSLFNVNLLMQLNDDLTSYLEKKTTENISTKEVYSYSLLTEATSLKNNLKALDIEIITLKNKINELNIKKRELNKHFLDLGGINKNKLKTMMEELNAISKEVEHKNKLFKYRIENESCFILNLKLLQQGIDQIVAELPLYYLEQLNNIKKYLNVDTSSLDKALQSKVGYCSEIIHDVGEFNLEQLNSIYENYNNKLMFVKKYLSNKESELIKINKFKNQIESQEQINKFDSILKELTEIDAAIDILNTELILKQKKYNEVNEKFNKTYDSLNYVNNEIRKTSTYDKSFMVANKSIEINKLFIEYIKEIKLKEISQVCTNIFNETIRKEGYISKIEINNDYSIVLYDIFNKEMKIKTLSAGEKQLLISSIIWSMFKVSGRKEIFVFDTPLARLDVDNRLSFINNIVKTISDQVIILSTDSEIVDQYYDTVVKNASKIYRLDYITEKKVTKIVKGYFG